jgi:hypothetical protein
MDWPACINAIFTLFVDFKLDISIPPNSSSVRSVPYR